MGLKFKIQKNQQNVHLTLEGVLDENCKLPDFTAPIVGVLTIDLGGVHTINSLGCRKWSHWIRDRAGAAGGVKLVNCSPAIVAQMNVLQGLLPDNVKVDSFFVPYFCTKCNHSETVLLSRGQEYDDKGHFTAMDEVPCPACKALMTMDAIKERYFKFLTKKSA